MYSVKSDNTVQRKNMSKSNKKVPSKPKKAPVSKQATCAYCEMDVSLNPSTGEWWEWCPECIEMLEEQALGEWLEEQASDECLDE